MCATTRTFAFGYRTMPAPDEMTFADWFMYIMLAASILYFVVLALVWSGARIQNWYLNRRDEREFERECEIKARIPKNHATRIPLVVGMMAQLPPEGTVWSQEKRQTWLRAMAEVLDLTYPKRADRPAKAVQKR